MPPRFFVDAQLRASPATIALPEAVAHHATRVLRLSTGDPIVLFDGTGGEYHATLLDAGRHGATVRIDRFEPAERESPLHVTLVQAILAADPMDYAVRKTVELGVTALQPVFAARTQRSFRSEDKRLGHWRAIAVAACEQCGRNRVPEVAAPLALDAWLRSARESPAVIAGPATEVSLAAFASRTAPAAIVVGPEGGFTDDEMALARDCGVVAVHLGPRVLRAETAGVAALAMLAALVGDAR
jgi:16S rRNA (uracil1498-N3)-methyltransferase